MIKPNLFIIGAPKCGTTSLARWLGEHPEIYVPSFKEPHHFNYDFGPRNRDTLAAYEKDFAPATFKHRFVCDASTHYLFSRDAVPAILDYNPESKFVVMFRNPVEMAVSLHEQTYFDGDENEQNFSVAWRLQRVRSSGARIPRYCSDPQLLQYGLRCKLGMQLQKLYERVQRERVHLIRLDDLSAKPRQVYCELLAFLGIEDDCRAQFPLYNRAKTRRFRPLWQGMRAFNRSWKRLGLPKVRIGLTSSLNASLRKERPRPPIGEELKRELRDYFREDVSLLESLTNWDLSDWVA